MVLARLLTPREMGVFSVTVVFLGIIVGFIVVAMYLPIFKMGEAT